MAATATQCVAPIFPCSFLLPFARDFPPVMSAFAEPRFLDDHTITRAFSKLDLVHSSSESGSLATARAFLAATRCYHFGEILDKSFLLCFHVFRPTE